MKKIICLFVSFILVLFSVRCPESVSAVSDIPVCFTIEKNGHVVDFNCYQSDLDIVNELKNNNYPYGYSNGSSVTAYTALMAEAQNRDIFEGSDLSNIFPLFCRNYDYGYMFYYLDFTNVTDIVDVLFTYYINDGSEYGVFNINSENIPIKSFYFRNDAGEGINSVSSRSETTSCGGYYELYYFPFLDDYEVASLKFYQSPSLYLNMDINELGDTFNINVENTTDNSYDYMIYISEKSANIGVVNSFNMSKWFMSSRQWCYQWLQDYSALNGSIEDYIIDNIADGLKGADILDYTFGNGMYNILFNAWGGAFDGAKEYFSVDDETMSFYQVSQTNCPVYRINANDTRTHTISYSSLNLELDKTYYLNIIYTPVDFNVYSAMTTAILDAGTGQQGNYPVFDTRNIAKYSVYDSYEFSVSNGVFSEDSNTLYSYSDLIKYTNPSNSVAKIESDDDQIIVSDNDSYDNSVSTEYINYGQIYHGCTFYNGTSGGSGGSGGLVEENIELKIYGVDDLDFEITQLSEPVSKFKQFMQSVFGFLPEEMIGLFILGISTCIICRILGR